MIIIMILNLVIYRQGVEMVMGRFSDCCGLFSFVVCRGKG